MHPCQELGSQYNRVAHVVPACARTSAAASPSSSLIDRLRRKQGSCSIAMLAWRLSWSIACEGNKGPATSPCSPGALMVSPLLLPPSLLRCLGQGKSCYAGASPFLGQNWAFVTAGSALWRSSPSCVRVRHENFGVLTLFLVSMVMSTPIFFYCTILPLLLENEDNVYPYFTVSWMP